MAALILPPVSHLAGTRSECGTLALCQEVARKFPEAHAQQESSSRSFGPALRGKQGSLRILVVRRLPGQRGKYGGSPSRHPALLGERRQA